MPLDLISGNPSENTETTPALLELNKAVEKLEEEVYILPESMRSQVKGLGIIASSRDVFKQLLDAAEQERPLSIDNKIIKDLREKLENVKWDNEMRENEVVYNWWKDYSSAWVKTYELLQLEHKEFSEDIGALRVFADIYKGLFYSIREDGKGKPDLKIRQRIDNAIEDFGLYRSGEAIPYEVSEEDLGQGLECFVVEPDATSSNIIFLRYFNKEVQQYEFVMVDGGSRQFTGALKNEIFPKIGLMDPKKQLKTIIFTHGDADHLSGGLAFAKEYGIHFRADSNLFETTGDRSLPQRVLQHALMGDFARIAFLGQPIDFDPGIKDLFEPYPGHGNQGEILLGEGSFNVLCYQDIGDTKWAVVQTGGHTQDSIMLLGLLRDEKGIDGGEFTTVITGDIGVRSLLTPVQKRMIKASKDMKGWTIAHVYPGTAEIVDKWLDKLPDTKIIPSHGKPYNSSEIQPTQLDIINKETLVSL